MTYNITEDEVLDWVSEMANDLAKISRPRSAKLAGLFELAAFTAKELERSPRVARTRDVAAKRRSRQASAVA
jgi:hypothetical protein